MYYDKLRNIRPGCERDLGVFCCLVRSLWCRSFCRRHSQRACAILVPGFLDYARSLLIFGVSYCEELFVPFEELRVVVLLIDHAYLRPCREIHVIVRPLQAYGLVS